METGIAILLGGVMNRFRGSGIPYCRLANVLVFGLFMGYALGWVYAIPCAVAMQLGQSLGWGRYIGALFGTEKEKLEEVWFIDVIIKPLKNDMQLWGAAGLALRGMFWASCIAVATLSPWLPFIGVLMPVCYYLAWIFSQEAKNPAGTAWETGEILWGAILWASVATLVF